MTLRVFVSPGDKARKARTPTTPSKAVPTISIQFSIGARSENKRSACTGESNTARQHNGQNTTAAAKYAANNATLEMKPGLRVAWPGRALFRMSANSSARKRRGAAWRGAGHAHLAVCVCGGLLPNNSSGVWRLLPLARGVVTRALYQIHREQNLPRCVLSQRESIDKADLV